VSTSVLNGLGQALRWLRERYGKKQYQVADSAGITKGMLSAYETGRQRPSMDTLEKVLSTLGCDLHDLHNALQIVNGRPQVLRHRQAEAAATSPRSDRADRPSRPDVYRTLGLTAPLPAQEEKAIAQILDGFHGLLRFIHQSTRDGVPPESSPDDSSEPPPQEDSEDDQD
jgi:transcriptional regulator with XRE-family HTH domain